MHHIKGEKPIYILGTGLSHNGSSCLLKDGKIVVAIEKERLSRVKHDGGNDFLSVQYCLNHAGISVNDLSLVVQVANFEKENIQKHKFIGKRFFTENCTVPFITISHHLAHAYSAIGTCPYKECNVLVIDGCGSPYHHCEDLQGAVIPTDTNSTPGLYAEKDSYYHFNGSHLQALYKDFSVIELFNRKYPVHLPTSSHSIGGFYSMVSNYCFGNLDDAGKLMGLAPYGRAGVYTTPIFALENGRVHLIEAVLALFDKPMQVEERPLKTHFQYYADIAKWVQTETEKAIQYIFNARLAFNKHENICYAGGVALNAVANTRILRQTGIKNLYIEPAAGDNGLALGCAFYGWIEILKQPKIPHTGSTLLGAGYANNTIEEAITQYRINNPDIIVKYTFYDDVINPTATLLAEGKIIGWFQQGAEFGPRALGCRSILADPRKKNVQQLINSNIKFREDFRPFAPSVLAKEVKNYFEYGHESPYMILIDRIKPEWKEALAGIVHVDGTCRVQTVTADWNKPFYDLLEAFKAKTGIAVLLNTSFNKKGMPIVETPYEAIDFFYQCRLDVLVLNNYIIKK
jgi:carbamoyltransferase